MGRDRDRDPDRPIEQDEVGTAQQSSWIRDKGMGMGRHIPKLVSPFTGEEVAAPGTGYFFPQDEENIRRWKGWWKVANWEQFLLFFVIGTLSILVFSVLACLADNRC